METKEESELELELAWLVRHIPKDLFKKKSCEIRQGYLQSSDPKVKDVRIREKDGKYTYTIKTFIKNSQETGFNREENKQLSKKEFENYWHDAVKKIREVDVYKDNLEGLNVVEVEFPSIDAYKTFEKPNWFGKEVTDSKGIYPPVIAEMDIAKVNKMNRVYKQKPHKFE